jgi:hypothetical protein
MARVLLGQHSDVEWVKDSPFPARIGVWSKDERGPTRFVYVGLGQTFEEALEDARKRQQHG